MNIFWLILMGGMQYQTEHHMFPQIPFYSLPKAAEIIKVELAKINKSIIYGPVLWSYPYYLLFKPNYYITPD